MNIENDRMIEEFNSMTFDAFVSNLDVTEEWHVVVDKLSSAIYSSPLNKGPLFLTEHESKAVAVSVISTQSAIAEMLEHAGLDYLQIDPFELSNVLTDYFVSHKFLLEKAEADASN